MKGIGGISPPDCLPLTDNLKTLGCGAIWVSPDRNYSGVGFVARLGLAVGRQRLEVLILRRL